MKQIFFCFFLDAKTRCKVFCLVLFEFFKQFANKDFASRNSRPRLGAPTKGATQRTSPRGDQKTQLDILLCDQSIQLMLVNVKTQGFKRQKNKKKEIIHFSYFSFQKQLVSVFHRFFSQKTSHLTSLSSWNLESGESRC